MKNILVIDDDPDWLNGELTTPLTNLGHRIIAESNRAKALMMVQGGQYDLVVLNLRLEAQLTEARAISKWSEILDRIRDAGIEVVVVTSQAGLIEQNLPRLMRLAFKDYKVADFIIKEEFNPKEYRNIIQDTLNTRKSYSSPDIVDSQVDGNNSDGVTHMSSSNSLSNEDRQRLVKELLKLPSWSDGGSNGCRSVLRNAGFDEDMIADLYLEQSPSINAASTIASLGRIGHIRNRPTHTGLGMLVEHMLSYALDVEGILFLANLLMRYKLVSDSAYIDELLQRHPLFQVLDRTTVVQLGWDISTPQFDWYDDPSISSLESAWSSRARFLDSSFLARGASVAGAVCRIGPTRAGRLGTGFAVANNLVLTCHHVLPSDELAEGSEVWFDFRLDETGRLMAGRAYQIKRVLSRSSERELDYVLLEINPDVDGHYCEYFLTLCPVEVEKGQPTYIIQHPDGLTQKIVLQDNLVTFVSHRLNRVYYLTNTTGGSSGAPVCNANWDVVALHHSGAPNPPLDSSPIIRGNEGILINSIIEDIHSYLPYF